jgi:hypothetical protein
LIYEVIRKRATAALIDLIDRGRAGENVDHSLLRRAIEVPALSFLSGLVPSFLCFWLCVWLSDLYCHGYGIAESL